MEKPLMLQMGETYPFGEAELEHADNVAYVVKQVPFSTSSQRRNILKKTELLQNLGCYSSIVALLDVQVTEDCVNLVYEYVPHRFDELLKRNDDKELGDARRILSEVTLELQQVGIASRINGSNVGLNNQRQLKCYVAIEEIPDFSLLQAEEADNSMRQQLNESEDQNSEGNNLSMEQQQSGGNIKSHALAVCSRLEELEKEVVKRSGVSNYYSERLEPVKQHQRVDDLLERINGRLMELSNRRRQTSPSRLQVSELQADKSTPKYQTNESTIASHKQRKNSAKLQFIREQLQSAKNTSSSLRASEMYHRPPFHAGEYQSLRTQRRETLQRIQVAIDKADQIMSGFRTSRNHRRSIDDDEE